MENSCLKKEQTKNPNQTHYQCAICICLCSHILSAHTWHAHSWNKHTDTGGSCTARHPRTTRSPHLRSSGPLSHPIQIAINSTPRRQRCWRPPHRPLLLPARVHPRVGLTTRTARRAHRSPRASLTISSRSSVIISHLHTPHPRSGASLSHARSTRYVLTSASPPLSHTSSSSFSSRKRSPLPAPRVRLLLRLNSAPIPPSLPPVDPLHPSSRLCLLSPMLHRPPTP